MSRAKPTTTLDDILIIGLALGPLVGVVAGAVLGATTLDLALFGSFWFATMFGIELGYHRYFSHRSFKCGRLLQALMIIFGSMSFQGPAIWWAATHRKHHKFADRAEDPHSPHNAGTGVRGMLLGLYDAHMGWNFRAYQTIRDKTQWKHFVPDLVEDRWLRAVNRGYFLWMALGLAIPAAIGGAVTGTWHGALTGVVWGGLVRLFAVNHGTYAVNSLCHAFGARPFALHSRDRSTNNFVIALFTFGAGWHHNHHVFPGSATNWVLPWQVDFGGALLRGLSWCGVVWDRGTPPAEARDPAWRRRMRVRVASPGFAGARSNAKRCGGSIDEIAGFVSGISEKGGFIELRGRAREVGSRITLHVETPPCDVDAIVERTSWRGVAVRFVEPKPELAALKRELS